MKIKTVRLLVASFILIWVAACSSDADNVVQGYVESENLYLASPFSGVLKNLAVARGEKVQKGDLIFELAQDPQALQHQEIGEILEQEKSTLQDLIAPKRKPEIGIAEEELEQVEARLVLSKLRMKRFRELYQRKAGNLDEADAAFQKFREFQALKGKESIN